MFLAHCIIQYAYKHTYFLYKKGSVGSACVNRNTHHACIII